MELSSLKKRVRELFAGETLASQQFHIVLIIVNLFVFSLFIIEAAFPQMHWEIKVLEIFFGLVFLLEYLAQLWVAESKWRFFANIFNLIDLFVIASLFMPLLVVNFAALRLIKWVRIFRVYRVMRLAKKQSTTVAHYWDIVESIVNFALFLLITTLTIYASQIGRNPHIQTHIDALYFTVATLTTTGYGDVTAVGQEGRLISVVAMIIGFALFARMSRALIRGKRKHIACPKCGFDSHEHDAVHCKYCGAIIPRGQKPGGGEEDE